jgi:hypothetical protein
MDTEQLRTMVREGLEGSLTRYHQDLQSIPADKFGECPGGCARSAADFTKECVDVNLRVAQMLRCEPVEARPWNGWPKAEGELKEKEPACAAFKSAGDTLLASFDALGDDLEKVIKGFRGEQPAFQLAMFAGMHIGYHDGQLNLLQAMYGDDEVHWG